MDQRRTDEASAATRKLLRQLRTEKAIRQQDLADSLGVPQSYVSKYESGERRLDIAEVIEICKALDLPLKDFMARLEALL